MASQFQDSRGQQGTVSTHQPAAQEQQRQPQPGAQPDKAENRGGFDCEFVEQPPDIFQSECPVCLQIIRDPYQVTCCGYSFCRSCIERIKADNKLCPTCNVNGFSDFPNKGLQRSLYAFKVRCSHQKDGCEWMGELGQLDVHLNKDPPPEKRHNGCPVTTISCDFAQVGCVVKLPRKDMPEHLRENLLTHTSLLAVSHANLASCNAKQQAQIVELVAENTTLRSKNVNLEQNHRSLETNADILRGKLTSVQAQISDLTAQVNSLKESPEPLKVSKQQLKQEATAEGLKVVISRTKIPLVPSTVLTMTDFQQHKEDGECWYSPPVYTHHQGYKFCLKVYANGQSSGAGTHFSVIVYFMRGEFDDSLKWPFRGVISLQLLDQLEGWDHKIVSIAYDNTVGDKNCSRVIYGERALNGCGSFRFINQCRLKPKYLRNDTLQLQLCGGEAHV